MPTTQSFATILFAVVGLAWVVYLVANIRRGRKEVGAELELAPNRKPYHDDETLEGPKLLQTQFLGFLMLVVVAIGLPAYWLTEPGRQAGAEFGFSKRFASWGSQDFAPTAQGGFNCAGCHGGMKAVGGEAPYTITDPNTGEVIPVTWKAPALNTVMYRFTEEEVLYILTYGRPFSPMSPWGEAGGGAMNAQQLTNIVEYLKSIQIPMEGCAEGEIICEDGRLPAEESDEITAAAQGLVDDGTYATLGEALFNLELSSGAYSCARCHTAGWSYDDPQTPGGGAALGPNLTGGSEARQFPDADEHVEFVELGSEDGKRYGQQGQGSGRMPAFGQMLTEEQIRAIVEYERGL
jgi:mono/diheme cytochrome c family protein